MVQKQSKTKNVFNRKEKEKEKEKVKGEEKTEKDMWGMNLEGKSSIVYAHGQ